jgi:hypothetical protein
MFWVGSPRDRGPTISFLLLTDFAEAMSTKIYMTKKTLALSAVFFVADGRYKFVIDGLSTKGLSHWKT